MKQYQEVTKYKKVFKEGNNLLSANELEVGNKYTYFSFRKTNNDFTLLGRIGKKLKIKYGKDKPTILEVPSNEKIFLLVESSKKFKEAEPQQQDKITGTVRKLAGMFFVKNGISGLQKELAVEDILFLMNEIKVEGKQFDTSKSAKVRKAISMILKNIEEQPPDVI